MKIGFYTAAVPNMSLEDILKWGKEEGFQALEVACWPDVHEVTFHAGAQHISVEGLTNSEALEIKDKFEQ